jgi:protein ImuA
MTGQLQERRMIGARMNTLASLRGTISRIEAGGTSQDVARVELGHPAVDATLQGGLIRGALHEVFALESRHTASATGFIAGLAGRLGRRPLLWIRHDFIEAEVGQVSMNVFRELGLDPRQVVTVRARDTDTALRITADALACDALGAVVLDLWGEVKRFDLVASRKLTLAAQASGVTCLMLRSSSPPTISTAETRWVVRAAPSLSTADWGVPMLDVQLVRNRHGQTGQWIMEWNCDECLFREPAAYSQPVAAPPADRPLEAPGIAQRRRAG